MNETIQTLVNHRSIRKFLDTRLTEEQVHCIIQSAQSASTSSFIQAYTIIGVTDPELKSKLASLAGGQPYVETNGHFFVFCADLRRHRYAAELEQTNVAASIESTEKFMVAVIDASLAAQNAAVAAESMSLGICYIGGIRNQLQEVSDLLQCPEHVLPLFGLAVGTPSADTDLKPRLPMENIYHENLYNDDSAKWMNELRAYNETIADYYEKRSGGTRRDTWSGQISRMLATPKRLDMQQIITAKGFMHR
ncbi:oxygen-insensitive NADPH nitroreductase [Salisediminibacterium halotolerans]|uniref:FMN reductase (NADPH) n=1 Tax=Salisediminibacterium halotolerans TaxID=517425 RepID=A0A1H9WIV3_9BACI|nr:oxygen-insensitive NADPH nitroreductase [Salisediminibacterium haloalkalitolerans]SES33393.1 FMN reductase (NADPH) [Salisediminibacterium haloalkalitolerans]